MSKQSIAQQWRRECERNECQQEPNQCATAQQQRRTREREAQEHARNEQQQRRTREREAQEHESTQSVITQQLQQACEQEAHESEPRLEIIA
ncbi:6623_t:CDS:2 [Gigaspora rosea]|nr:6623_t:CDS:2 [Gigaspora rosea]